MTAMPMSTIIRSEDMGLVQSASDLLEAASRRKAELEYVISSAMREAQERGYAHGRAQALRDMEIRLKETMARAERELSDFEDRIVKIVIQGLEKILGEMPDNERVRRVVNAAIQQTAAAASIKLRVAPDEFDFVVGALRNHDSRLTVVADAYVGRNELLLEVDGTRQQIGLADQLANLLEAIRRG
ncbi:type III secretion system stator protein SctL [Rhizobium lemnae]|uniref:Flagellar assembly protein FliH n=1 Tax=Rhizobium lemnae TaxID=1214924 RepID=A0ABV8EDL2_9HYPH|nr:type III secretion system stator protein SctL [Rhizobium lemnae]MCJ8510175.1 type III secretion system stator protein SctL [Rhizobium lemnae]